jgi:lysophospholipase
MTHSLDTIQDVLSQMVRLSAPNYARSPVNMVPDVMITPPTSGSNQVSDDAAAPWSWTAAEASNTEASLLPFLIHLAVARDDVEGVHFCIHFQDSERASRAHGNDNSSVKSPGSGADAKLGFTRDIGNSAAGGIVNYVDPGSGHAPLHVAALNGSMQCLQILLEAGALVHLRDKLGHTALYYVSFTTALWCL